MHLSQRRLAAACAAATGLVLAAAAVLVTATAARAAAGCRVDYTVTNQWSGGFGAAVTIVNLGDPVAGWQLTWSFSAGQAVVQLWNGTVSQAGAQVRVTDAGHNANIATGGSAAFGFNGSWTTSNPAPAAFALNGTPCTGAAPSASAVPSTPTSPGTSASPSAPTSPGASASPGPSTSPGASAGPSPSAAGPTTPPAAYPNPGRVTGSTGAHDPTVVRLADGTYLLVATGNNLPLKTSSDRVAWRDAGVVWPGGAPWTTAYTGGAANLWAPDISYRNGRFHLYYSASTFGSQRSAIFLATSTTGAAGSWTNQGLVIESSTAVNYNAIDPNLFVDADGRWWLTFGSFWTGIKSVLLDPATGKRSTTDTAVRALAQRPTAGGAIEAPFVHRRGGYYYLFVSFDLCCRGAASTYRIMVGRSTSPTGPFTDRNGTALTAGGGTQVLAGRGSIHGPGHQHVLTDNGQDVLFYHYYADNGAARLGINLLGWDSAGWPFVH